MKAQAVVSPQKKSVSYFWWTVVVCALGYIVTKDASIPPLVITIGAVIIGTLLVVRGISNPQIVTYALVAYLPFSKILPGDFGGAAFGLNFTNLLMLFILFVWFTGRFASDEPVWLASPLNFPIYLFLTLGLLSIVRGSYYGGHLLYSATEFKRWMTPIFMYFLVLNTVKEREFIRTVVILMCIVTTVAGLMAIYDYLDVGSVSSLEKSRIGGIAQQPNMLAAFFNYYMFIPFGFFLLNIQKPRYWLLWIPFLICFRGIMVTFSRGGYLAFGLGLYAIIFFRNKLLFFILIFFTFVVFLFPTLLPAGIRYRMGQTFHKPVSYVETVEDVEDSVDKSSQSRIEVWKGGIAMVKDHPFFGIGYGLFQPMIAYYWSGRTPIDAHNTYLILAAEMGIPALLAFIWILWSVFRQTLALYRSTQDPFTKALALGFLGGLFGLMMSNLFGSRLDSQEVSSYFWILAAVIMRLQIMEKREAAKAIPEKGINIYRKRAILNVRGVGVRSMSIRGTRA